MSAHTPGPWHVFSVYAQHEVRTPTDTLVAVVNSRDDARLIAAAPELLEAAKGLHMVCALALAGRNGQQFANFESRSGHFVSAQEAMRQVESAITKATGAAT